MMFDGISVFFVVVALISTLYVIFDVRKNRQSMRIMEAVWPLTALWASFIGLIAYFKLGREKSSDSMSGMDMSDMDMKGKKEMDMPEMSDMKGMDMSGMMMGPPRPMWQRVALSALHCGAGCTLADIIGEWFTYFVPVTLMGSWVVGQWVLDYILALIIGVYFQYAAIQPMQHLPTGQAIWKALKIDFFSLTSWQIGMYGWMAICIWGIYGGTLPAKTTWEFWFLMQIAMLFGFITAYPTNWILVKLGIKQAM